MAIKNLCRGSGYPVGGRMGASNRGRKNTCPVCGREIGQRSGKNGRLFDHAGIVAAPWANVIPHTDICGEQHWSVYNGRTGVRVVTVRTKEEAYAEARAFDARVRA